MYTVNILDFWGAVKSTQKFRSVARARGFMLNLALDGGKAEMGDYYIAGMPRSAESRYPMDVTEQIRKDGIWTVTRRLVAVSPTDYRATN